MENSVKLRLLNLGKKQVDLLKVIRKKGYTNLQPPQLSSYINGANTTPQAKAVMQIVYETLEQWEAEISGLEV